MSAQALLRRFVEKIRGMSAFDTAEPKIEYEWHANGLDEGAAYALFDSKDCGVRIACGMAEEDAEAFKALIQIEGPLTRLLDEGVWLPRHVVQELVGLASTCVACVSCAPDGVTRDAITEAEAALAETP